MPTTVAAKICRHCQQDVSTTKRVKDAHGNYYCQRCYDALPKQAPAATRAPAAASTTQTNATPDLDNLLDPDAPMIDLSDLETAPAPAAAAPPPKPVIVAPLSARPAPAKSSPRSSGALPDFCPNCDAPVIANRKLCVKCHKDVTQMDAIIARKAAAGKVDASESAGLWIARAIKGALVLFVLGVVVFLAYGGYLMFHPGDAFDDYPTTRAEAVHTWLSYIADGSDKSLEKAFLLVSFRERQTNNTREDELYKSVYHRMHDDFVSKYGSDWLSKVKIENAEPGSTDEVVPYKITLNADEYFVSTQVQLSVEQAVANLTVRRDRPSYPENGKRHFGILEIDDYSVHAKSTMLERVGPGKPFFKPN